MKWGIAYLNDGQIQHVEWKDTPEEAMAWAVLNAEEICCTGLSEHMEDEDWLEQNNMAIHQEDRQGVWSLGWFEGGSLEWQLIQGPITDPWGPNE